MIEDVQNNIIFCRRPSGIPAKSSSLAMWKLDLLIYGHFFWKRLKTPTSGPLVVATVAEKTDDNMISYIYVVATCYSYKFTFQGFLNKCASAKIQSCV